MLAYVMYNSGKKKIKSSVRYLSMIHNVGPNVEKQDERSGKELVDFAEYFLVCI